jgi:uncharacterized protein
MAQVKRFDVAQLRKTKRLANGWLRTDAHVTRAGVFNYRMPDGTVRRELRSPEEVFHADSIASLEMVPLTNEHPSVGLLDDTTAKEFTAGHVGENIKQDDMKLLASVIATDAALVKDIESGDKREVSCGYKCDVEMTPGTWKGERYDAIQRNIRYNHVAVVKAGRAGSEVRVRLDAADAVMVETASQPPEQGTKEHKVKKIRIDGVEYEVSEQVAQALEKANAKMDSALEKVSGELKTITSSVDKEKARADTAEAALKKAESERKDAVDPAKFQAAVKARVELERKALDVLGTEEKVDAMDDKTVKLTVLKKLAPEAKLDGKSEDYVQARFDAELERFDKDTDALGEARKTVISRNGAGDDTRLDADAARKKFMEDSRNAWKKPLTATSIKSA